MLVKSISRCYLLYNFVLLICSVENQHVNRITVPLLPFSFSLFLCQISPPYSWAFSLTHSTETEHLLLPGYFDRTTKLCTKNILYGNCLLLAPSMISHLYAQKVNDLFMIRSITTSFDTTQDLMACLLQSNYPIWFSLF